jgi:hypothetical protein
MPARCLTLLTILALAFGLAACGSDDTPSPDIPRASPDLTIPTTTTQEPAPADTTTTGTTSTTDTTTTPVTPPAAATPQAPAAPPAPAGSATTGGAAPTGQSTTGGATAGGGEFENFCAQNPGAF